MIKNQTLIEYYIDKHEGHETRLLKTWEWLLLCFLLVGATILLWTCLKFEPYQIPQEVSLLEFLNSGINSLLKICMDIAKWTLTIATPIVVFVGCFDILSKHGIDYNEPEEK